MQSLLGKVFFSKNAITTELAAPIMLMIDTNIHTMIDAIITRKSLLSKNAIRTESGAPIMLIIDTNIQTLLIRNHY